MQVHTAATKGGAEAAATTMGNESKASGRSGGNDAERNKSREVGMLDSVLKARSLIFEASFYPMCHADVQEVMKQCKSQAACGCRCNEPTNGATAAAPNGGGATTTTKVNAASLLC